MRATAHGRRRDGRGHRGTGEADADTDADTDSDTDADSDSDTDTDIGPDADKDGYGDDVDCDDANPAINPGAEETCGNGRRRQLQRDAGRLRLGGHA